jgi:hypothetical protein
MAAGSCQRIYLPSRSNEGRVSNQLSVKSRFSYGTIFSTRSSGVAESTMKFTLTALLAAVGLTEAKKLLNKKTLLRNAVPVNKDGARRLEEVEEFEITGEYSIQFNHCLSLKLSSDGFEDYLFDENYVDATAAGKILAQQSFVLFNVCQTNVDCYYQDDENLYMVDLPTYMGAIIEGEQEKEEGYCQACEESYETC